MFSRSISNFSLEQIADSGQCFRLLPCPGTAHAFTAVSGSHALALRQENGITEFFCPETDCSFWESYFDLDTDYAALIASVDPEDSYLSAAAAWGSGIRILRQDLWEMMVTFIISQQKTIPAIRSHVETLSRLYGTPLSVSGPEWISGSRPGGSFSSFPTPEQLNLASLDDLISLKLGYRAKYIKKLCEDACSGHLDLELLKGMNYDSAMEYLQGFYGIGKKVASCICLFGLHHVDAFPVDTWIRRILMEQYAPRCENFRGLTDGRLCEALVQKYFSRYKGCAGIMQQYIFYYARTGKEPD